MSDLTRDDIRAAVGSGMISEAQAASLVALAQTRSGVREHMSGLDEPFELFRGFNEIFIVVGLVILYSGWLLLTGFAIFGTASSGYLMSGLYALISMGVTIGLARYFTLTRRMVAPSITLAIFFLQGAWQLGLAIGWMVGGDLPQSMTIAGAAATVLLIGYYAFFRVPFTMALIAGGVFVTTFAAVTIGGEFPREPQEIFLLSAEGPFALLTILLGLVGLIVALRFDMSDPHRLTRRAQAGFWLHVIAAPAIVNTVALTLYTQGSVVSYVLLFLFILAMAIFAVAIDRRSFLVSGVGYIVAMAVTIAEGQAYVVILLLGLILVFLGAQWEVIRRGLMNMLPGFPGKTRLPPWEMLKEPA